MEYRNWTIDWCPYQNAYEAIAPDYEPVWLGQVDGWLDGERFTAATLLEAQTEIDARIEEQAEYQAACAADAEIERAWEDR